VDLRPDGPALVLPPLLRLPTRPRLVEPGRAGRAQENDDVLAAARRVRVPVRRRTVRPRAGRGGRGPRPAHAVRILVERAGVAGTRPAYGGAAGGDAGSAAEGRNVAHWAIAGTFGCAVPAADAARTRCSLNGWGYCWLRLRRGS
jgi:hypothetical protein